MKPNRKAVKYSAVTEDGLFIQSDNIDHFRLQDLKSFCITEQMTEEEVRKHFGRDYELPKDFSKPFTFPISKGNKNK